MTQHPLSKATRSTAQSYARQHLFPAFGGLRLNSITPELLTEFIRSRTAAGLDPGTVRHMLTLVGIMFNVTRKARIVQHCPRQILHLVHADSFFFSATLKTLPVSRKKISKRKPRGFIYGYISSPKPRQIFRPRFSISIAAISFCRFSENPETRKFAHYCSI